MVRTLNSVLLLAPGECCQDPLLGILEEVERHRGLAGEETKSQEEACLLCLGVAGAWTALDHLDGGMVKLGGYGSQFRAPKKTECHRHLCSVQP